MLSSFTILALLGLMTLIPVALAQTTGEFTDPVTPPAIEPEDDTVGPVGITDELIRAHSIVTDIMTDTALTRANVGYVDEEFYLKAVWIDEKEQELVIMLDPLHLFEPVTVDDLQENLGLGLVPIRVEYGLFETDAPSSQDPPCPTGATNLVCYYWGRYVNECLSTSFTYCASFGRIITNGGYALPAASGTVPADTDRDGINDNVDQCDTRPETFNGYRDADGCPDTIPTPPSSSSRAAGVVFQDNFENGLGKWIATGSWRADEFDESDKVIPGYTSSNKVAEADGCSTPCSLSMRSPINLSSYSSATLEFDRFVDRSLDSGEYLAVHVGNNGAYREILRWTQGAGDDDRWNSETIDLKNYLRSGFKVKFVTKESRSSEDVAVDNVKISTSSRAECVLSISAELQSNKAIKVKWNSCEGVNRYDVYLSENGGSRSLVRATTGTTYTYNGADEGKKYVFSVKARYTDSTYTGYFHSTMVTVPISDRTAPIIMVPSDITVTADSDSGKRVTFTKSAYDRNDGAVSVSCRPESGSNFRIGTTTVVCKAHDRAGNQASESFVVTVVEPVPEPEPEPEPVAYQGKIYAGGEHSYTYEFWGPELTTRNLGGGTVGYTGYNTDGKPIFVGAAHTFTPIPFVETYPEAESHSHSYNVDLTGNKDEHVISNAAPISSYFQYESIRTIDAALVEITNSTFLPSGQIAAKDETIIDLVHGDSSQVDRGDVIRLFGNQFNSVGTLEYKNATIRLNDALNEYIMHKQFIGNYSSQPGDSGGAVVMLEDETAKIIGIHHARACLFISPTEGLYEETDLLEHPTPTDNRIRCSYDSTKTFTAMSPWNTVRDELGIR